MEIVELARVLEPWYKSIAAFVLMVFAKWLFENLFLKYVRRYVEETENTYDDFVLFAVEPPCMVAIYVCILYVALINAPLSYIGTLQWPIKLLRCIVLLTFFWAIYRLLLPKNTDTQEDGIVYRLIDGITQKNDTAYANMISIGFRIVLCFIAFGAFTKELGYDITAFLASLSIGTAAILYASKDAFSNVISSIIILLDKPFAEKEWIKTNSIEGIVEEISFRSTKIHTFTNEHVYIPSSLLVNAPIINVSKCEKRRIQLVLHLSLDTTAEALENVIVAIRQSLIDNQNLIHVDLLDTDSFADNDEVDNNNCLRNNVRVHLLEINYVSYDVQITCFMKGHDQVEYLENCSKINLDIIKVLEKNNVKPAFKGDKCEVVEPIDMLDFVEIEK